MGLQAALPCAARALAPARLTLVLNMRRVRRALLSESASRAHAAAPSTASPHHAFIILGSAVFLALRRACRQRRRDPTTVLYAGIISETRAMPQALGPRHPLKTRASVHSERERDTAPHSAYYSQEAMRTGRATVRHCRGSCSKIGQSWVVKRRQGGGRERSADRRPPARCRHAARAAKTGGDAEATRVLPPSRVWRGSATAAAPRARGGARA